MGYNPVAAIGTYLWDTNQYYNNQGWSVGGTYESFSGFQAVTGFDTHGRYQAPNPTNTVVFVRTNAYEAGRANIIVYNWALSNTVGVDVSSVLAQGASYEVRNAQDFFGAAVLSGTYDGTPLRLPMTGLTVATPVGFSSPPPPTGPAFNVFILRTPGGLAPASNLHTNAVPGP
jgi:hypothetical protein